MQNFGRVAPQDREYAFAAVSPDERSEIRGQFRHGPGFASLIRLKAPGILERRQTKMVEPFRPTGPSPLQKSAILHLDHAAAMG